jgi:hypothetical protein
MINLTGSSKPSAITAPQGEGGRLIVLNLHILKIEYGDKAHDDFET